MKSTQIQYALGYGAFGSILFNLGSILFWSLSKAYLPDNEYFLVIYGFLTSVAFLKCAKSYLDLIDNLNSNNN